MTDQGLKPTPVSPEQLLERLEVLGIAYTLHTHAPIFTVEEGEPLKAKIAGVHCRNLFLRDNKEVMLLVIAANETRIDLKKLSGVLGVGRLSFGSADRLWTYLGIRQGSVNPFCIMNDTEKKVRIILDKTMMQADIVNYHPMDNAMTIGINPTDLRRFIEATDHAPEIVDLSAAAPD